MSASIADVVLDYTWKDINTASGYSDGSALVIQNKSHRPMYVWLGNTAPTTPDAGFFLQTGEVVEIEAGEPKVWIFGKGKVNVQQK